MINEFDFSVDFSLIGFGALKEDLNEAMLKRQ